MAKELAFSTADHCTFDKVTNNVSGLAFVFLIPALVVIVSGSFPAIRGIWVLISIVVLLWSLSFTGSGGDRKGCVDCEMIIFYFILAPILAMGSFVYCMFNEELKDNENEHHPLE
ncbi:hypothetical protein [Ketobacter sp.]|uniref:hypothetical protein n=1 Tax=Ketobacter sp. TaxID=2083498 RepID=UPI000F21CF9F|nr:hypothetical protein [Ketobacter sp.]RLT92782.1 MAG: hypothetical protein D9N14_20000 [Ketobacter sp.]